MNTRIIDLTKKVEKLLLHIKCWCSDFNTIQHTAELNVVLALHLRISFYDSITVTFPIDNRECI